MFRIIFREFSNLLLRSAGQREKESRHRFSKQNIYTHMWTPNPIAIVSLYVIHSCMCKYSLQYSALSNAAPSEKRAMRTSCLRMFYTQFHHWELSKVRI